MNSEPKEQVKPHRTKSEMVEAEYTCHITRSFRQGKPFENLPRKNMGYSNTVISSMFCNRPVWIQCELWHCDGPKCRKLHIQQVTKYVSEPDFCVPDKCIRICHCFVLTHVSALMPASAPTYPAWCLITQNQECQQPLLTMLHLIQSILLHIQYMCWVGTAPQVKAKGGVIVIMQSL